MKRAIIGAFLSAGLACALCAQADLQPLVTIKIGRAESITLKQLRSRVEVYQKQRGGAVFSVSEKKEILDAMIDEKLVVQAAQKAGISVSDTIVNQQFIDGVSQQIGRQVTEQEFASIIKQNTGLSLDDYIREQTGMNVAEYKAFLRTQLIAQQYIMREKQDELRGLSPSDREIRDYYALNQSNLVQSETLKLFLVIVKKGSDSAAANKRLVAVFDEIKNGKPKFDDIKKRFVSDPDLKAGDIYVSRTQQAAQQLGITVEALGELFGRDIGFVSAIIETPSDFQFYVVRERHQPKFLALSDVVQPESTTTVYEFIRARLEQEKQARFFMEAVKDLTESLRTAENFQMLKTGAALDKLLDW